LTFLRSSIDLFLREFSAIVEGIDDELFVFIVERPNGLDPRRRERHEDLHQLTRTQSPGGSPSRTGSPVSLDYQGFMPVSAQDPPRTPSEAREVCGRCDRASPSPSSKRDYFVFGRRTRFWKNSQFCIPEQERAHSGV
jgi:hypothetical protein